MVQTGKFAKILVNTTSLARTTVQKDIDFLSVYLARITLKNVLQGDNQTHSGNAENARNQRGERVD